MYLAVFHNVVDFLVLVYFFLRISNYSSTLNILNKNISFQLPQGMWKPENFLASSVISGYLYSMWIAIKFSFRHACF